MVPAEQQEGDHDDGGVGLTMKEVLTMYPHEFAVAMRATLEFGVVCNMLLLLHMGSLVVQFWPSELPGDLLLQALCAFRIMCAVPRPYSWYHLRKAIVAARYQPTPQLVAGRLWCVLEQQGRFKLDYFLGRIYLAWLAGLTVLLYVAPWPFGEKETPLARKVWGHLFLCFGKMILDKVVLASLFYYMVHSEFSRGIPADMVEHYSRVVRFRTGSAAGGEPKERLLRGDQECSICFGDYESGELVRELNCKHHFHKQCVDPWLLHHQNRCPLCLELVGPKPDDVEHHEHSS